MATLRTRTVKSSAGDYSSLAAWEAGEQTDIVTADEIRQAECYNFTDGGGGVTLDGWTTDATRYIDIVVPVAERHGGQVNTGYRLDSAGFLPAFSLTEDFIRISGVLMVRGSFHQDMVEWVTNSNTRDIRVSNCVFDMRGGGSFKGMEVQPGTSGVSRIWNNILVGGAENLINVSSGTAYIYNNTAAGETVAASFMSLYSENGGTVVAKNNIGDLNGWTGSDGCFGGTFTSSNNNMSTDSTAPGSSPRASVTPTFVNRSGANFLLDAADTAAKGYGANLSADSNLAFSTDILGNTRGGTWDIGAHQVTAASTNATRAAYHRRMMAAG